MFCVQQTIPSRQDWEFLEVGVVYHNVGDVYLSHTAWSLIIDFDILDYRFQIKSLRAELRSLQDIHNKIAVYSGPERSWILDMQTEVLLQREVDCDDLLESWGEIEAILQ